jgi:cobalt-zinc-cadmium efflux system outer membrane protein
VAGSLDAPLTARLIPAEEAYTQALENRPDLQALRWRVSQAQADMTLEHRKAFPQVTPAVGYTRQYQQRAIGFPDADSWSAAVSMTLPLYDKNQGNQAKAASVAVQSRFGLQAAEVELRAEIDSVVEEFSTARSNAEAIAKEQLQLAAQVRNSILKSFKDAEALTLLDVLDAQRTYRETYRLYITSRAGYWRALSKLKSAIGAELVNDDEAPH